MPEPVANTPVAAFLTKAKARFQMASVGEQRNREEAEEDDRFAAADQWPEDARSKRATAGRPVMTINRVPAALRLVTNPQRQARPSPHIDPIDGGAEKDVADIYEGIIRDIYTKSHAEIARDTAFESAVRGGWGYYRILSRYLEGERTFDQELYFERILNRFTVYVDQSAKDFCFRDARFWFVVEDVPKDEYDELYPTSTASSLENFSSIGDVAATWFPGGKVRIAEYWYEQWEETDIVELNDGNVVEKQVLVKMLGGATPVKGQHYKRERKMRTRRIYWSKINAIEVLEGNDDKTGGKLWPGKFVPIIPVIGDEIVVRGERVLRGLVRDAKEPQRAYNYWTTATTEAIALAPKAPYVAAAGQISAYKQIWDTANTENHSVLPYDPVAIDGNLAPPPQRNTAEPAIMAMVEATRQADNDFKLVTQFFDPSLGQNKSDQSGIAIRSLQQQGAMGNVHFLDNLERALLYEGEILLDLIPIFYDRPGRIVQILGLDGKRAKVMLGALAQLTAAEQQQAGQMNGETAQGAPKAIDLKKGRYGITVNIGASVATKRQEAVQSIIALMKVLPPMLGGIIADKLVENMDVPGNQEIADRIKKSLPPQFQEDTDASQIPPKVMAQINAANKMIEMLSGELKALVQEKQSKQLELASKEYIAGLQTQAQLVMAMSKVDAQMAIEGMKAEYQRITTLLNANTERLSQELETIRGIAESAAAPPTTGALEAPQLAGAPPSSGAAPAPGA